MKKQIEKLIFNTCKKLGYQIDSADVSFSKLPDICDYQSNICFALAKKVGKAPFLVAQEIVQNIQKNDDFDFVPAMPGYINIVVKNSTFSQLANQLLNDKKSGVEEQEKKLNVVMDYGGANVAKELHVGHLCSPIIGESMKRLYKLLGHNVVSDAHLGDWGLQMGLTILQLKEDGYLDYYFSGKGEEPQISFDLLNVCYPKASARKSVDPDFKKMADDFTKYIQDKQEPYFTIYKKIRAMSVKTIERLYQELGATFDVWYGESSCADTTNFIVDMFVQKGLARESEGALVVDVAREGEHIPLPKQSEDEEQRYKNPMPPAVIKKYNGADLYATTDIATIYMRNQEFNTPDEIVYFTDNRQSLHFEQVFRCCKLVGISPENQKLIHIGFGTMKGKDGKPFKTREGTTVKLEDVINLLIEKSSEKLQSNGLTPTRELALQIGIGAMKYGALSNYVSKDYVFDLDRFLCFDGKTGPYIQYMIARINSILSKSQEEIGEILVREKEEKQILVDILKLNASYYQCFQEKSMNSLCASVFDLASSFSTFYNNHKILTEQNEQKRKSYLALITLVRNVLKQALWTLGIESPERM